MAVFIDTGTRLNPLYHSNYMVHGKYKKYNISYHTLYINYSWTFMCSETCSIRPLLINPSSASGGPKRAPPLHF